MVDNSGQVKGTLDGASSLRRKPNQRRSRERVEKILDCAVKLIAQDGSDAMRMNEIARLSGISIGSLYQYFPDKGAIIQTLAERYNAQGRACTQAAFLQVHTMEELQDAFEALIDEYYEMFLAEPVIREIWSGTQANKSLNERELADCRMNAMFLADTLKRLNASVDEQELSAIALLIINLAEAAMRLAISVPRDEGEKIVTAYKRLALTELKKIALG